MGARSIHCALALVSTLVGAPLARAATKMDSIPAACGSRAAFDAELRARLGKDAPLADVFVAITPRPRGFHLRVHAGAEQRELEDPSCTELFRAAIVIAVSMLVESEKRTTSAEPPPLTQPPARPPRSPPSLALGLGAGLAVGTLPKPVLALELEGKLLWRHVGVGANVRYLVRADRRDSTTQQGAELSALGASVTGIFRPAPAWEARLGFAAQGLFGTGLGVGSGSSATVWAAGPTLGLGWAPLRYGPISAGIGAEGQLNLARGRFEILNYSGELTGERHVVYQVPWLAAGAFVRLGVVW
ncbi:MAG: hypothetical protein K0R38_2536 [Polyangiaceae bacterium]|jgi:hypothetical protein|nr:hypothetical protein [Polyangiaceae bacterium]